MFAPWMLDSALDIGHAAMVENEPDIGCEVGQPDRLGDLVRQHDEIEGQARTAEPLDVVAEQLLSERSSGITCRTRRKPLTKGFCLLAFEIGGEISLLRPAGCDHSSQHAAEAAATNPSTRAVSASMSAGSTSTSHVQRALDADTLRFCGVLLIGEIAVERRYPGKPGIAQGRAIDEMQMCVDDHTARLLPPVFSNPLTEEFFIQIKIYCR